MFGYNSWHCTDGNNFRKPKECVPDFFDFLITKSEDQISQNFFSAHHISGLSDQGTAQCTTRGESTGAVCILVLLLLFVVILLFRIPAVGRTNLLGCHPWHLCECIGGGY